MEERRGVKVCGVSNYRILLPEVNTFCLKYFKNAVDFHPKEKLPCKNSWHQDLRSSHIRNKRLLDLPYTSPRCCTDIYNIINDRQKLKRLQRYGLTRAVREMVYSQEVEEEVPCQPDENSGHEAKITYFPECYIIPESDTDEEDDEYKSCESGSESECSGCSTLGGGTKRKLHKVVKKSWRDLLHKAEERLCGKIVADELTRHKKMKKIN